MKRFCAALAVLLLAAASLFAQEKQAIVRIASHGITGTVIESRKDYSLILSCAHGFVEGGDRRGTAIKVDVPMPEGAAAPKSVGRPRLIGLDVANDLSLIELPAGPFPVIPLAPLGHRLGSEIVSCGYDEMKWQDGPLLRRATVLGVNSGIIWTKEIPWHGRSGGPLVDVKAACVVGVVQGYEVGVGPGGQKAYGDGMYIATARVQAFVAKYTRGTGQSLTPQRYGPELAAPVPQTQNNDGWEYDPRTGGYFRNMRPGTTPPLPRGKIQVEEQRELSPQCLPGRQ